MAQPSAGTSVTWFVKCFFIKLEALKALEELETSSEVF